VPKDRCETRGIQHPQGLLLQTQEHEPLFRINGIQTQSAQCVDLMPHWQDVRATGANGLRYCPVDENDGLRITALKQAMEADVPAPAVTDLPTSCGYWFQLPGILKLSVTTL
jgi:hypothetical protein